MRSQFFLISIGIACLTVTATAYFTTKSATDIITSQDTQPQVEKQLPPEEFYSLAKAAYANSDCQSAIVYLTKYLEVTKPDKARLESITEVKKWCSERQSTVQYSQVTGGGSFSLLGSAFLLFLNFLRLRT